MSASIVMHNVAVTVLPPPMTEKAEENQISWIGKLIHTIKRFNCPLLQNSSDSHLRTERIHAAAMPLPTRLKISNGLLPHVSASAPYGIAKRSPGIPSKKAWTPKNCATAAWTLECLQCKGPEPAPESLRHLQYISSMTWMKGILEELCSRPVVMRIRRTILIVWRERCLFLGVFGIVGASSLTCCWLGVIFASVCGCGKERR
jgi:hypothetical protein